MAALIEAVTALFTAAIGWVGDVAALIAGGTIGSETVSASPLLLLFAVLPLVGLGVGLFKRMINVN